MDIFLDDFLLHSVLFLSSSLTLWMDWLFLEFKFFLLSGLNIIFLGPIPFGELILMFWVWVTVMLVLVVILGYDGTFFIQFKYYNHIIIDIAFNHFSVNSFALSLTTKTVRMYWFSLTYSFRSLCSCSSL